MPCALTQGARMSKNRLGVIGVEIMDGSGNIIPSAEEYRLMHWRRIISASRDLWKERGSICRNCHRGSSVICLFCYCPLYHTDCGGDYEILDNGIKDCSGCRRPHEERFCVEMLEKLYHDSK